MMNRYLRLAAFLLALCLAAGLETPAALAEAPVTNAKRAYIVDYQTGTVILDINGEERVHPASMSKLMTIYMLFDALKRGDVRLDDTFHVSQKAWSTQGSKMFVDIDSDVKVEDLIRGIIIQSGNDACIVVAEGLAGSEEAFAERMNKKAVEIGLTGSNFINSSGWPDPNHLMTPKDLAILARRLIDDFPDYYRYFSETEFTFHGIKQGNRNPLLYRVGSGVDGLKTGHTEEAGFGLTASAVRDGRRIIMIVHGLNDMQERADDAGNLLDWAFREFSNYTIAAPGMVLADAQVWMGMEQSVPLTVASDIVLTLKRSERQKIVAKAVYMGPVEAPIAKGQEIGTLIVRAAGMPEVKVPLLATKDVAEIGFGARVTAALNHFIGGTN